MPLSSRMPKRELNIRQLSHLVAGWRSLQTPAPPSWSYWYFVDHDEVRPEAKEVYEALSALNIAAHRDTEIAHVMDCLAGAVRPLDQACIIRRELAQACIPHSAPSDDPLDRLSSLTGAPTPVALCDQATPQRRLAAVLLGARWFDNLDPRRSYRLVGDRAEIVDIDTLARAIDAVTRNADLEAAVTLIDEIAGDASPLRMLIAVEAMLDTAGVPVMREYAGIVHGGRLGPAGRVRLLLEMTDSN